MRNRHKITPEIEQQILRLYLDEKLSAARIKVITGISTTEVFNIVKRNGHQTRDLCKSHKIYEMDVNFFKDIDTEEKAYVLGILYADGTIDGRTGRVSLMLQQQDTDLLVKINSILQNTCPINKTRVQTPSGKLGTYCRLSFHDRDVAADLINIGLVPNKTCTMEMPTIREDLVRHFIRGFWDGDGTIYSAKRTKNFMSMSVAATSSKNFCEQLRDTIYKQTNLKFSVRKAHSENPSIGQLVLSNKTVRNFLDYLYKDANIYMERKHQKYLDIIRWQDQNRGA